MCDQGSVDVTLSLTLTLILVPGYEDSFVHKNRTLCIVMAFCQGGDLASVCIPPIELNKVDF